MAGGGVHGKVGGIARSFMAAGGYLIKIYQVSILMWTQVGEQIIENVIGTVTGGTMNGFLTNDFNRIGKNGKRSAIGRGRSTGGYGTIDLSRNNRDRI
jgi:hypothetical protein